MCRCRNTYSILVLLHGERLAWVHNFHLTIGCKYMTCITSNLKQATSRTYMYTAQTKTCTLYAWENTHEGSTLSNHNYRESIFLSSVDFAADFDVDVVTASSSGFLHSIRHSNTDACCDDVTACARTNVSSSAHSARYCSSLRNKRYWSVLLEPFYLGYLIPLLIDITSYRF